MVTNLTPTRWPPAPATEQRNNQSPTNSHKRRACPRLTLEAQQALRPLAQALRLERAFFAVVDAPFLAARFRAQAWNATSWRAAAELYNAGQTFLRHLSVPQRSHFAAFVDALEDFALSMQPLSPGAVAADGTWPLEPPAQELGRRLECETSLEWPFCLLVNTALATDGLMSDKDRIAFFYRLQSLALPSRPYVAGMGEARALRCRSHRDLESALRAGFGSVDHGRAWVLQALTQQLKDAPLRLEPAQLDQLQQAVVQLCEAPLCYGATAAHARALQKVLNQVHERTLRAFDGFTPDHERDKKMAERALARVVPVNLYTRGLCAPRVQQPAESPLPLGWVIGGRGSVVLPPRCEFIKAVSGGQGTAGPLLDGPSKKPLGLFGKTSVFSCAAVALEYASLQQVYRHAKNLAIYAPLEAKRQQVASLVQHNLVRAHGVAVVESRDGHIPVMVMDEIKGPSCDEAMTNLNNLRATGAISHTDYFSAVRYLLRTLLRVHALLRDAGMANNDVKPDNVLIDTANGEPVVIDLGVSSSLDSTAAVSGFTPKYAAPETHSQRISTQRSDVYAIASTLEDMVDEVLLRADSPTAFSRFMAYLKQQQPHERASFEAALAHPFLSDDLGNDDRAREVLRQAACGFGVQRGKCDLFFEAKNIKRLQSRFGDNPSVLLEALQEAAEFASAAQNEPGREEAAHKLQLQVRQGYDFVLNTDTASGVDVESWISRPHIAASLLDVAGKLVPPALPQDVGELQNLSHAIDVVHDLMLRLDGFLDNPHPRIGISKELQAQLQHHTAATKRRLLASKQRVDTQLALTKTALRQAQEAFMHKNRLVLTPVWMRRGLIEDLRQLPATKAHAPANTALRQQQIDHEAEAHRAQARDLMRKHRLTRPMLEQFAASLRNCLAHGQPLFRSERVSPSFDDFKSRLSERLELATRLLEVS